jgi:archaellum component FlaC
MKMANLTKDDIWKMVQILMSITIIPLAGWVWNTNTKVAELQNDLGDAEEVIDQLESRITNTDDNSKQIIGMGKDIEYMKDSLGRIEGLVTRKTQR